MDTPLHRHPTWHVQGVTNDHGGAAEFAYTTGLAPYGIPDVHVWARPGRGTDPAHDYWLSLRTMASVLNDVCFDLLDDIVEVGDERPVELDDGLATMLIEIGRPVPASACDAFHASTALVVPLHWSLERCDVEPDPGIDAAAVGQWRSRVSELQARTPRVQGLQRPDETSLSRTDLDLGPLEPWVHAVASGLAGVPAGPLMSRIVDDVAARRDPDLLMQLRSRARTVGRVRVVERVGRLAERVVRVITQRRGYRLALAAATRRQDLPFGCCQARHLEDVFRDLVEMCLLTAALEDVATAEEVQAVRAPWVPFVPFGSMQESAA